MAKTARAKAPKKLFYKIGEVCEMTRTEPYVLRYWESEFPFLAPSKNRSGQRIYKQADIELVKRIKELLYGEGYTIAGARRRLEEDLKNGRAPGAEGDGEFASPARAIPSAVPAPLPTAEAGEDRELREAVRKVRDDLRDLLARLSGRRRAR